MPTTYTKGRIYKLNLAGLQADPGQPRKFIDPGPQAELTASVMKMGVLEPILFRVDEQGRLFVVAGERRVEAARAAGLTEIPGLFVAGNYREISLIENMLRQDLTPIEEAEGMKQVMDECNYSQSQLSDMIGKTQASVSQTMSLNNLPENVRDQCRTNTAIPKAVLLAIAALKSPKAMQNKFRKYMDKQRKPAPEAAKGPKPTKAQAFLMKMDEMHTALLNIPWRDWTEVEREDLMGRLRDMRGTAQDMLVAMGDTDEEEREPEDEGLRNLS